MDVTRFISRPATDMVQGLQEMFICNMLTDVILLSHNMQEVKAHGCVLATASPVLKHILSNDKRNKGIHILKFENVRYPVLKLYVDSLYMDISVSQASGVDKDLFKEILALSEFLKDCYLASSLKNVWGGVEDFEQEPIIALTVIGKKMNEAVILQERGTSSSVLDKNTKCATSDSPVCEGNQYSCMDISDEIEETEDGRKMEAYERTQQLGTKSQKCTDKNVICGRQSESFIASNDDNDDDEEDDDISCSDDNRHSDKALRRCRKCELVFCRHRQQRLTPTELDYIKNKESVTIMASADTPLLHQDHLSDHQKSVAEQCKDILNLPPKILMGHGLKRIVYPCLHCHFLFLGFSALLRHLPLHSESRLPKLLCSLCPRSFQTHSMLRKHDQSVHCGRHRCGEKNGTVTCQQCGVRYLSDEALQRHRLNHENDLQEIKSLMLASLPFTQKYNSKTNCFVRNYNCTECGRNFKQLQLLQKHLSTTHCIKPPDKISMQTADQTPDHMCADCGARFAQSASLRAHKKSVHSDESFVCEVCGKTYKAVNMLRAHIDHRHADFILPDRDTSDFQCSECGGFVPSERVYRAHVRWHRTQGRPLKCRFCSLTFKYHSGRLRHEKAVHKAKS